MEDFKTVVVGLVLAGCVLGATGESVQFQKCYVPTNRAPPCEVHEVRVTPCPEAAEGKPCKISLPINITFSFDFTPTWNASKLDSGVYKVDTLIDVPYDGLDSIDKDGCKFVSCPVVAGQKHVYNQVFSRDVKLPSSIKKNSVYTTKVKIWNADNHREQCCYKIPFELV